MILKAMPYILAFGLLAMTYILGHVKGTASCEINQGKQQVKGVETNEKIEHRVVALPDPALDAALAKWMRD